MVSLLFRNKKYRTNSNKKLKIDNLPISAYMCSFTQGGPSCAFRATELRRYMYVVRIELKLHVGSNRCAKNIMYIFYTKHLGSTLLSSFYR